MAPSTPANGEVFDLGDTEPETVQVKVRSNGTERTVPCFTRKGHRYIRDVRLRFDTAYSVYLRKTREAIEADNDTIELNAREGFMQEALSILMPDLTDEEKAGITQERFDPLLRKCGWLGELPKEKENPAPETGAKNATPKLASVQ
jgi:hypothetical protein